MTEETKAMCETCRYHHETVSNVERACNTIHTVAQELKGMVSMSLFKWMFGGIGVVMVIILGAIITLHTKFAELESMVNTSTAVQDAKIEMITNTHERILDLQRDFTIFIMRHDVRNRYDVRNNDNAKNTQ